MLQRRRARRVAVHARLVLHQVVGHGDRARDRAARVDLRHHVLLAGDAAVLLHVELGVVVDGVARGVVAAVAADVDVRALHVLGHVAHAALLGHADVVHVLEGGQGMTAAAGIGRLVAVQDDLGREVALRPGALGHHLQAVAHGRGGSERPACSAVLGNVLVLRHRDVVVTVQVSATGEEGTENARIVALGKLLIGHKGVGLGSLHQIGDTSLRIVATRRSKCKEN